MRSCKLIHICTCKYIPTYTYQGLRSNHVTSDLSSFCCSTSAPKLAGFTVYGIYHKGICALSKYTQNAGLLEWCQFCSYLVFKYCTNLKLKFNYDTKSVVRDESSSSTLQGQFGILLKVFHEQVIKKYKSVALCIIDS